MLVAGTVPVSAPLVRLYSDYMHTEYGELDSDYVFVNLWSAPVGRPLRYVGVRPHRVTPHTLRHSVVIGRCGDEVVSSCSAGGCEAPRVHLCRGPSWDLMLSASPPAASSGRAVAAERRVGCRPRRGGAARGGGQACSWGLVGGKPDLGDLRSSDDGSTSALRGPAWSDGARRHVEPSDRQRAEPAAARCWTGPAVDKQPGLLIRSKRLDEYGRVRLGWGSR